RSSTAYASFQPSRQQRLAARMPISATTTSSSNQLLVSATMRSLLLHARQRRRASAALPLSRFPPASSESDSRATRCPTGKPLPPLGILQLLQLLCEGILLAFCVWRVPAKRSPE